MARPRPISYRLGKKNPITCGASWCNAMFTMDPRRFMERESLRENTRAMRYCRRHKRQDKIGQKWLNCVAFPYIGSVKASRRPRHCPARKVTDDENLVQLSMNHTCKVLAVVCLIDRQIDNGPMHGSTDRPTNRRHLPPVGSNNMKKQESHNIVLENPSSFLSFFMLRYIAPRRAYTHNSSYHIRSYHNMLCHKSHQRD